MAEGPPTVLVRDGRMDQAAMARQGISEADLLESLRMKEAEAIEEVRLATLERSGKISVIRKKAA